MLYPSEMELVKAFTNISKMFLRDISMPSGNSSVLLREYDSGFGIADIVIGITKKKKPAPRRSPIVSNWVLPLIKLGINKNFTTQEFMNTYGVSMTTANKCIQSYISSGFVKKLESHNFQVIKEYECVTEEIIAIEAKLKDWKRGLAQALRYKKFANQVFLLIDRDFIAPAISNIGIFNKNGVGLVSLGSDGVIEVHCTSEKKRFPINQAVLKANETIYRELSA